MFCRSMLYVYVYMSQYIYIYSKLEFNRCRMVLKLSKSFVFTYIMSRSPPYKNINIYICNDCRLSLSKEGELAVVCVCMYVCVWISGVRCDVCMWAKFPSC